MKTPQEIAAEFFATHSNASIASKLAEAGYEYSQDQVRRMRMKAGIRKFVPSGEPTPEQRALWIAEFKKSGSIKDVARKCKTHHRRVAKVLDEEGFERKRMGSRPDDE